MDFKLIGTIIVGLCLAGCETVETKQEAFPRMYGESRPDSILVVPAVNKSTAADATDYINATLAQPLANAGYYVFPIPLSAMIFNREGILDGEQLKAVPKSIFARNFGADSVLFVTINKWDKNYAVLAANVTVGMSYVLVSTKDDSILWSYEQEVVVDTSGDSSAGLLGAIIATAIQTATTDYMPVAVQVNAGAMNTLPVGKYHPRVGSDGEASGVLKSSRENAVAN